jgi:hypothetical protein
MGPFIAGPHTVGQQHGAPAPGHDQANGMHDALSFGGPVSGGPAQQPEPMHSQPSRRFLSQSNQFGSQLREQVPALHVPTVWGPRPVVQLLPQKPQLSVLFVRTTSQPFVGSWSQSAKPAVHV